MSKILLLVHVEEMFRRRFNDDLIDNIINLSENFNQVIHFTSYVHDEQPVEEISPIINEEIEWGWGYEPRQGMKNIIPANGHEWTWIPPRLLELTKRLKESEVVLGGGCHGECLADMESVLSHLEIPYKLDRRLIYG